MAILRSCEKEIENIPGVNELVFKIYFDVQSPVLYKSFLHITFLYGFLLATNIVICDAANPNDFDKPDCSSKNWTLDLWNLQVAAYHHPNLRLLTVILIFISSLLALRLLFKQFPELEEHEKQHLKLPWNLKDAKHLGMVLDRYRQQYFYEVLFGVFLVYIFLQTFAIPGSSFLSILAGFLFPFYLALLLVSCCSAIGASLGFLLDNFLGKMFFLRTEQWANAVIKHQNNLLKFALEIFIGVAFSWPSLVAIFAGYILHRNA